MRNEKYSNNVKPQYEGEALDMDFINKEHLYTNGGLLINGKSGFKYADIIIGCHEEYYHAVFLKWKNFFTIMMDDYQTIPTIEIATKVLTLLLKADMAGPSSEKPDKDKIKQLLDSLNHKQKFYKVDNYIVRIGENSVQYKKALFLLNSTIPLININACITNIGTTIQAVVSDENRSKINKYDQLFFISIDGEKVFRELMCITAHPDDNTVILDLVTEHEYYMKHSQMGESKFVGNTLWAMQIMDYTLNWGRDIPIEMRYEDHSINVSKKRFFFLFSMRGIKIQKDVRFGLVTLSNESGIAPDRKKEFDLLLSESNDCYAQIAVVNNSLRQAVEEALNMIDKVIMLLHVILLDDSPHSFFDTKDKYKFWNIETLNASFSINEHFYVEDVIDAQQYAILNRKNSTIVQPVLVDEQFIELLNKDNILEDFFYLTHNKEADDMMQAIVWLNASRKAADKKEKIISLYNSVEFLVSGEKGKTLSQELESNYKEEYTSSIKAIKEVIELIENKKLRERINGVVTSSFEGNSSVQSKLEALIERLHITFETLDWELFDKLKENRQKLIHNKKIIAPITNQELSELFHLFSKIIIYKIIAISKGGLQ